VVHDEQALVIGSFYSMNGLQQCVEGLIAYSIALIEHAKLKSWQIIFTVRDHLVPHSSSYMACVASGLSNCCLWLGGYQIALYERNASSQKIACFWQSESVRTTLVSRTGVQGIITNLACLSRLSDQLPPKMYQAGKSPCRCCPTLYQGIYSSHGRLWSQLCCCAST
jgi:hypothetical protein